MERVLVPVGLAALPVMEVVVVATVQELEKSAGKGKTLCVMLAKDEEVVLPVGEQVEGFAVVVMALVIGIKPSSHASRHNKKAPQRAKYLSFKNAVNARISSWYSRSFSCRNAGSALS